MHQQKWKYPGTNTVTYRCGVILDDGTMNREAPIRKYGKTCRFYKKYVKKEETIDY